MSKKLKVLFLCTGNSCRSQIAQGWARHLKSGEIEAYSAGIRPIGLSSRAVKVMAEVGVDISGQRSKHFDEFADIDLGCVVTVCDNAKEQCPVFPGRVRMVHQSFEDPYFATGSEEEVMATFRRVRDQIKAFVETMPQSLHNWNNDDS
jgi:arsenate reductase